MQLYWITSQLKTYNGLQLSPQMTEFKGEKKTKEKEDHNCRRLEKVGEGMCTKLQICSMVHMYFSKIQSLRVNKILINPHKIIINHDANLKIFILSTQDVNQPREISFKDIFANLCNQEEFLMHSLSQSLFIFSSSCILNRSKCLGKGENRLLYITRCMI